MRAMTDLEQSLTTHLHALRALAVRLVGAAAADDVVQDVALETLRCRPTVLDGVRGWCVTVLRRCSGRRRLAEGRRRERETGREPPDEPQSPVAAAVQREMFDRLHAALRALPQPQQDVLLQRFFGDLTPSEIARANGVPVATVKSQLRRGIAGLRERLDAGDRDGGAHWREALAAVCLPAAPTPLVPPVLLMTTSAKLAALTSAAVLVLAWVLWPDAAAPPAEPLASPADAVAEPVTDRPDAPLVAATLREPAPADAAAPRPTAATESFGPAVLWGEIVDAANGTPISRATVELRHCAADEFWNLDLELDRRIAIVARTESAADGTFRFDVVRAKSYRVAVRAPGYAPTVVVGQFGGAPRRIGLSAAATLDGVVRSANGPLEGLQIRVVAAEGRVEHATTRTAADGTFRCGDLPPGKVTVRVGSAEWAEHWEPAELGAGRTTRVAIQLASGRTVRGRVVMAARSMPIADAEVSDMWTFARAARTGLDGTFALHSVRTDAPAILHVRARSYATATTTVALDTSDVEFRLVGGAEVTGKIVDAGGSPLANAYVAVAASRMNPDTMVQSTDWIGCTTGADGFFLLQGMRADHHYWLMARAAGRGTRLEPLSRVFGDGERLHMGDVVLQPGGGIEGRVVDDVGAPVGDVTVEIRFAARARFAGRDLPERVPQFEQREVRSDPLGNFRIGDLAGGPWLVRASTAGRETVPVAIEIADGALREGVVIVVPRESRIAGVVVTGDGSPAGAVHVLAVPDDPQATAIAIRTAADGTFAMPCEAKGTYTVSVQGARFTATPIHGVAAGTLDVRLVVEPKAATGGR